MACSPKSSYSYTTNLLKPELPLTGYLIWSRTCSVFSGFNVYTNFTGFKVQNKFDCTKQQNTKSI